MSHDKRDDLIVIRGFSEAQWARAKRIISLATDGMCSEPPRHHENEEDIEQVTDHAE